MSRHTAGSLLIAGLALTWGAIGLIVREVPLPALTIVAFRVLLSATTAAIVLFALGRGATLRHPPRAMLLLGALLALHWSLYFSAIKETSIASAVLVTYSAPIFMALIAPALIRERVPQVSVIALGISAVGIAAISFGASGGGEVKALGIGLALGAAISMAVLVVLLKRWAAEVDPAAAIVFLDGTATVLLCPAFVLADYSRVTATDVGYLVILGSVLTGLAGIGYVTALRWVPATTAGILAYVEPVSAAVLAAAVLGEALTLPIVLGGLGILVAGALVVASSSGASVEEPVPVPRRA